MNISRKYSNIIFLTIVSVAAGLRLYHLGYYSLWMDEVYQLKLEIRATNISQVINSATLQNQPPLDYIIGYIWSNFFEFSEFSVRFPSFIFGTFTVALTFVLSQKIFSTWTAILSTLMISLSTIFIYYSQEARPYSIFFFSLLLLLITFFWCLKPEGKKNIRWIIFTVVSTLTLLTRGMVPVTALIALNISFLLAAVLFFVHEKRVQPPFTPSAIRNLILSTAVSGLFYTPFFLNIWENSQKYVNKSIEGSISKSWSLFEPFILLTTSRLPHNLGNYTYFCLIGMLAGSFYIIKERRKNTYQFIFLLYALIEPIISIYLYYIVVDTTLTPAYFRYFVQSVIPIVIISSYGYYCIVTLISRTPVTFNTLSLIPIIVVLWLSIPTLPAYYTKPKADYRGVANYLKTVYNNEDVIIYETVSKYKKWEPHLYGKGIYYGKKLNIDIRQFNWKKWVDKLENGFQTEGRLFLFLSAEKKNVPFFPHNDIFIERVFYMSAQYDMSVIYIKDETLSLKESSLIYIDELLKILPNNSSKVDLYVSKARLICQEAPDEAKKNIAMAENFLNGQKINFNCRYEK